MEKSKDEVALLIAQSGPLNGQRWALRDHLLIGRDEECDIVVPDRQVSRHHARISLTPEGALLEDLESKNGTHLNGKALETATTLQDGDNLQIALAQKFLFLSSDATLPLLYEDNGLSTEYLSRAERDGDPLSRITAKAGANQRLYLDKRAHRVWIRFPQGEGSGRSGRREIEIDPPLSASQFRLLELLYDQQGRMVTRPEMVAAVWGEQEAIGVSEQALDAMIRRLRDRLAGADPTHAYIITVRGHGLRLDNPLLQD